MIVATHGAVAAGGHIHRATGHVWGLVGAWAGTLHGHMIWPWENNRKKKQCLFMTPFENTHKY